MRKCNFQMFLQGASGIIFILQVQPSTKRLGFHKNMEPLIAM